MLSNDFVNSIVSSGTLREQDLIQACMSFLDDEFPKDVDPIYIHRYNTLKDDTYISDACSGRWSEPCADIHDPAYERLTEALIEVFELMDAIAPLGCYFGSSEGDGACIGFWEIDTDDL
jgi:hypothetical protein